MAPALTVLARARRAFVVHVALQHVGAGLVPLLETATLSLLKDTGLILLASMGTPEDTHDVALLAHLLALTHRQGVVHAFDGVRGINVASPQSVSASALRKAPAHPSLAAATPTAATAATATTMAEALHQLEALTNRPQSPFTYHGSVRATAVVVVLAPLAPALIAAADLLNATTQYGHRVGVVAVRVLRPWLAQDFVHILPRGVQRIAVVEAGEQADGGLLLADLATSFYTTSAWSGAHPSLSLTKVVVDGRGFTPVMARETFERLITHVHIQSSEVIRHPSVLPPLEAVASPGQHRRVAVLWEEEQQQEEQGESHTSVGVVVESLKKLLSDNGATTLATLTQVDPFATSGHGLAKTEIVVAADAAQSVAAADAGGAHVVVVRSLSVLKSVREAVARQVLPDGVVLLLEHKTEGLAEALGAEVLAALKHKNVALKTVTLTTNNVNTTPALLAAALPTLVPLLLSKTSPNNRTLTQVLQDALRATGVSPTTAARVQTVPLPTSAAIGATSPSAPTTFSPRVALSSAHHAHATPQPAHTLPVSHVAWRLIFPESFATPQAGAATRDAHEPELFRVKLTKNQRLTPLSYSRNIFHLEMDIRGTGLKYQIGDALGVYGQNDRQEVEAFLAAYGIQPDTTVSVEHAVSGRREILTAFTLFRERLDLFGKPSQKFYGALAAYATDSYQRAKLEWLGTEDKEGYKLRQLETVTYADVLAEFHSARPPLEVLIGLVPHIKPRHYSIASSMNMCPDSVHLLVVLVDWITPKGRTRYGQCTRYLASLNPDDEPMLTVDIKPSAMHLPKDPKQPVIMAGLGTGMAPFRAFIQEREWQRRQGLEVGPMMLYFGSRHRSEEYLYGDYLDAMKEAGLITKLGLAFSRDQEAKVYIQHKITEDRALVVKYLREQRGHFYLCGPTWPVPDVKKALVDGVISEGRVRSEAEADDWLEELKEEGRYVLEVY